MAGRISKAISAITGAISNFRLVSPFKITGVASSSEFKHYLDDAPDYRSRAPGSQPIRAIVPHADEDRIYNIKYFDRDTRREGMLVGGTNKTHLVTKEMQLVEVTRDPIEGLPPRPGKPYKWGKPIPYLEFENNGYT